MISEPTTTLTDYLIAVAAFIFAGLLLRRGYSQKSVCWWAAAFAWVGLAAALGGTCHGFVLWLGNVWSARLWQIMVYALSFASVSMLVGTLYSCLPAKRRRFWLLVAFGKGIAIWTILLQMPQFNLAAADYISAMAIVLMLQTHAFSTASSQTVSRAAVWMIAGILVSGLAIGILGSGFALSAAFNHNDLYHLVQLGGLALLYQGAKQLSDG